MVLFYLSNRSELLAADGADEQFIARRTERQERLQRNANEREQARIVRRELQLLGADKR